MKLVHSVAEQGLVGAQQSENVQDIIQAFDAKPPEQRVNELRQCLESDPERRTDPCRQLAALHWLRAKGHTDDSFRSQLGSMEQAGIFEVLWVEVPFLGIKFDINDLGTFSAIGQCIIAVMLLYSTARHHENLYLCLWKVRKVAQAENRYNDGQSRANFLYHAMAMSLVFSRPPTLARWVDRWRSRVIPMILFVVPVLVQGLVMWNDKQTVLAGVLFSPSLVKQTFFLHVLFGLALLVMTVLVVCFSLAADIRWRNTFFEINPGLMNVKPSRYGEWLFPNLRRRYRFVCEETGELAGKLMLVELQEKKHWQIRTEVRDSPEPPLQVKSELGGLQDWHFNPLMQSDGKMYQATGILGNKPVNIALIEDEHDLRGHRWTVRRGATFKKPNTKDLVVIEAVGERLFRLEEREPLIHLCTARSPRRSVASSQRGILDVAVQSVPELILFIDTDGLVQKVDSGRQTINFDRTRKKADGKWIPITICCNGGRVYVAERRRKILARFRREVVRIRVLNSLGNKLEEEFRLIDPSLFERIIDLWEKFTPGR